MDESMMSIEGNNDHFDDDEFIVQALNDTSSSKNNIVESSIIKSTKFDVSSLISNTPKCRLNFDDSMDTPRNTLPIRTNRKRKNFSRRCLSTDLNVEHSENEQMFTFQEFHRSKEIKISNDSSSLFKSPNLLSSIENRFSPITSNCDSVTLELTPEFNTQLKKESMNKSKSKENKDLSPRFPLKSSNNNLNRNSNGISLQKCFSDNHASIMRAVQKSCCDPNLIGDFSKTYALPLMQNSKHQDLKSINCHVLADLLQRQRYTDYIRSFTIIDCRYPYEYEGGHIKTAINLYTQEHILNRFIKNNDNKSLKDEQETQQCSNIDNNKRDILIFHCEFSSERGPSLCRFLRNKDRLMNMPVYPKLHYPEIYLLEGGYKEFFAHYSNLCEPCGYQPMHSKNHEEDLRKFRSICKSFESKHSTYKRNLRL